MSKLPKISSNTSDSFINHSKIPIPLSSSTTESRKSDFVFAPFMNHYNTFSQNNKLSPFAFETKLNEFESKMIALEHTNINLLHRLEENERKFERQLQMIQSKTEEERESRFKTDKAVTGITDNYNYSSVDLRARLNAIQDMIEKDERWKIDQRNREMDMYKNLINKVTEKVGSIVKLEVDARYKSDNENKLMVNGLNTRLENEIELMRRDLDEFMTVIRQELNRSFKECGERADSVSKYFDQQLANAMFGSEYNHHMKGFVLKLTEQVKSSLLSQGSKNELIEERVKRLEDYLPQMKESSYHFISTVEERIVNKVRDIQVFSEINISKVNESLSHQIANLAKSTDDNMQLLSNQIINTRNRMNLTLDDISHNNKQQLCAICEDLTSLANRVYLYEAILKEHENKYDDIKLKIENEINSIRIHHDVQTTNERIIRAIENEELKEAIRECVKAFGSVNSNFAENMTEINKSSEMNFIGLIERMNILQDMMNKSIEKNGFMFDEMQKNFEKIETKQMVNEFLFTTEDNYIIDQLEKNRLFQINTKNEFDSLYSTFNSSGSNMAEMINEMKASAREKEVKDSVNRTIENILIDVDLRAKDLYSSYQANQNEAALLNALTALDNRFQDHINNNESEFKIMKELIDSQAKNNLSAEIEIKCTLQQIINNAEFDNIYSQINKLNTMPMKPVDSSSKSIVEDKEELNKEGINDVIDSKINNALEKIKNENVNMWINSVELTQKLNQLEEIKQIITKVPPVIIPMSESMKRIMDLNYDFHDNPHPLISTNKDAKDNISNQIQMNDL